MEEWLQNNEILMYFTHNEGKSVLAERLIKILKSKNYQKMTAYVSKSYLSYLNKLVDQYNNICHHCVGKKPINDDYSALTDRLREILKLLSLNLMKESELQIIRMF